MNRLKGIRPPDANPLHMMMREATRLVREYLEVNSQVKDLATKRTDEVAKVNKEYGDKSEPLIARRQEIANRLYELATILIGEREKKSFLQLTTGKLSFIKGQDSLRITDEPKAMRRIAKLGWSSKAIKVERSIRKPELKKLLKGNSGPKTIAGTEWVPGGKLLYIDDEVRLDRSESAGPPTSDE